ncbi:uncharacterized protein [Triticum aestivum]|uniref:uncharacterized protein isoform X3 n=1 Tax=Triticum aestivum TaxID=4565 RepID=UPI001D010892|nr:uncharacterized protein LOC123059153 isoform X3 [Triticum aestivum]
MRGCERCRLYKKNLAKVHNYRKMTASPALRGNQIRKKHTHHRKEDAPTTRVALHGAAIHQRRQARRHGRRQIDAPHLIRMWIAGAGCTLLHGRSQPRAHSSPCLPPPAVGCMPSPWPPQPGCAHRHGQAATYHGGGEFVLEPAGVYATRSMPRRRKLHPAVKIAASNAV